MRTEQRWRRSARPTGSVRSAAPVGWLRMVALLLATFALVASACGDDTTDSEASGSEGSEASGSEGVAVPSAECVTEDLTIGYATKSATNQAWVIINAGVNAGAEGAGVELIEVGPANENDITTQIPVIEDLINRGVDALAIAPTDSAGVVPSVERANDAGIPVVAIDTAIEGGDVASLVATDNLAAATQQAELVGEAIGGSGDVVYVAGSQAQQTGRDRQIGFVDGMAAAYPNVNVLVVSTEWDATAAQNGVQDLLNANPDIAAIAHAWDGATMATLPVVESLGVDPFIAGFDGAPNSIAALLRGEVDLIVAQSLFQIGFDGITAAIRVACGEDVDANVNTGAAILTADTVDAFIAENPPEFAEFIAAEGVEGVAVPSAECVTEDLTIGYATKSATNQAWVIINAGVNAGAEGAGVELIEVGPANENDITTQIPVIEDLINRGVDALAIAPTDSAGVVPSVERANDAGIPVVAIDTAIEGGDVASLVATDNLAAATQQAELVGEAIGGSGDVVYVAGSQAQQTGRDRQIGFVDGMAAAYPNVNVLVVSTEWDATAAQNGVQDLLNANPDIAAIAHAWDGATMATLPVVESLGVDPFIAGFDGAPNSIAALLRGEVDLIVAQSLFQIGFDGITAAIRVACGEDVDANVNTGAAILTADTVDAFIAENPPEFAEFIAAEG